MLPRTPPQRGLTWHIGEESTAAEIRQASEPWVSAYIDHDHVSITPEEWDLHRPQAFNVDLLFICMRLPTMSRARETQTDGPGLLRSRRWPWGFPEIGGAARLALERDNILIKTALAAIREVSSQAKHPTILLIAPEDRGGDSASLWQMPELRRFAAEGGWFRYGFHQCELQPSQRPRPSAVLSLCPLRDPRLLKGWPKLKDAGSTYLGPLGTSCKCGRPHEPWPKRTRPRNHLTLEPGVAGLLLSIAHESGLTRHLWKGRQAARQTTHSKRQSSSPSPSIASSLGSDTTCVSLPSTIGSESTSVQWDNEAASALGIPKRSQDSAA